MPLAPFLPKWVWNMMQDGSMQHLQISNFDSNFYTILQVQILHFDIKVEIGQLRIWHLKTFTWRWMFFTLSPFVFYSYYVKPQKYAKR